MKNFCILLGVLLLIPAASFSVAQPPVTLPNVTAYNLSKNKVTLPQDLSTPASLLVFSFLHDQEVEVKGWEQAAASLPGLSSWSLPIFPRENVVYRWWMNSSLRSSTHDSHELDATVPLYLNKSKLLGSLQIHSEREVVVLLVSHAGTVLWRTSGPVTPEKKNALSAAFASVANAVKP